MTNEPMTTDNLLETIHTVEDLVRAAGNITVDLDDRADTALCLLDGWRTELAAAKSRADAATIAYEDVPDGPIDVNLEAFEATVINFRSVIHRSPLGIHPGIVLDAANSAGDTLPPILFVGNPSTLRNISAGIGQTVAAAIRAATAEAGK